MRRALEWSLSLWSLWVAAGVRPIHVQSPSAPESPVPSASPAAAESAASLDGRWKGTTSQGKPIELDVKDAGLVDVKMGWRIEFEKVCRAPDSNIPQQSREGVHRMHYQAPESLKNGTLTTQVGVEADLDLVLTAAFAADGTATGQIDLKTSDSSPCKGSTKASWKGRREQVANQTP
jgi:hypothetical protein